MNIVLRHVHLLACSLTLLGGLQGWHPARAAEPAPLKVALIGDSTVSSYPDKHANRGWGQYLQENFREDTVTVINLATPGRSTKTFLSEGRWEKTLQTAPDFVFIQFGHNDSHVPEQPESTDAATTYKDNLRRYVEESRKQGITPILVTPMVRRVFDEKGHILSGSALPDGDLVPYATAMKEVAAEKKVPVIDLHTSSKILVEKLGPQASAEMASKRGDVTHFNERGARAMTGLVLEGVPAAAPQLARLLK